MFLSPTLENRIIEEWLPGEQVTGQEPRSNNGDMRVSLAFSSAEKHTTLRTRIWQKRRRRNQVLPENGFATLVRMDPRTEVMNTCRAAPPKLILNIAKNQTGEVKKQWNNVGRFYQQSCNRSRYTKNNLHPAWMSNIARAAAEMATKRSAAAAGGRRTKRSKRSKRTKTRRNK